MSRKIKLSPGAIPPMRLEEENTNLLGGGALKYYVRVVSDKMSKTRRLRMELFVL